MKRAEAIKAIISCMDSSEPAVFANGRISREGLAFSDRKSNFYMLLSMGHASTIALGIALHIKQRVFVLDGDGNLLMNLSALAMISNTAPKNLVHIVLDNKVYGTTGSQRSGSENIALEEMARSAGYPSVKRISSMRSLKIFLKDLRSLSGPLFLLVEVETADEPSPVFEMLPLTVKKRFQSSLVFQPKSLENVS